jgi:hypothetical protein
MVRRGLFAASVGAILFVGSWAQAALATPTPSIAWSPAVPGSSPPSYDFGGSGVGQTSRVVFTLTNSGGSATSSLTITLTGSPAFSIPRNGDGCSGTSVGPGKSCKVTVQFAAGAAGQATAVLTAIAHKPDATAALKLLGEVRASPTLTTTPSPGGAGGTILTDSADLSGGFNPTGSITFSLYGPSATADCSHAAVSSSTVTVAGNGSYPSAAFTPGQVGTYWWTASYGGDTFNGPASSGCGAESATITTTSPTISTVVRTTGIGQAGATAVGDSASLGGFAGAVSGETVSFALFGPYADGVAPTCATGPGEPVYTTTGTLDASGAAATAATFTPPAAGTYVWVASYGGDGLNGPVSAPCNAANESVLIRPAAAAPTGTKTASGSYTTTYAWDIHKTVDKTVVKQFGGTATFNYTVTVTHDAGTVSNVRVAGTIDVKNANAAPVTLDGLTDRLSDGTVCTVNTSGGLMLTQPDNLFHYSCTLGSLPQGALDNTATATWSQQTLGNGALLAAGQLPITFAGVQFTGSAVGNCVSVSDTLGGDPLGTRCVGDADPPFTYANTVSVPLQNCTTIPNTATFTTNDGATGTSSQSVKACGPAATGAETRGFWINHTGQGIITGSPSTGGVCNLAPWLSQYPPFGDLSATASCADVATYVTDNLAGVVGLSAVLKGQVLSTALNVFFSDPALGGNELFDPVPPVPIGGVSIDLNVAADWRPAFGGASSLTVLEMIASASSQSNVGGTVWYGGSTTLAMTATDAFDAVNAQGAFAA